jgi:hypothetical protein
MYQKPVSVPDISFILTYRIFSNLGYKLFYLAKRHFILGLEHSLARSFMKHERFDNYLRNCFLTELYAMRRGGLCQVNDIFS